LKLTTEKSLIHKPNGFRAKSTKTRIETVWVQSGTQNGDTVLEQNPPKQGLKLACSL